MGRYCYINFFDSIGTNKNCILANDAFWRESDCRLSGGRRLKVGLLGHIQSVIYLDPEISDGALQLRMAEEELHGAQVPGLAINLGSLRTPHRVRAIKGRLKPMLPTQRCTSRAYWRVDMSGLA